MMDIEETNGDIDTSTNIDVEIIENKEKHENEEPSSSKDVSHNQKHRYLRLPLARVKSMMKMDPGCAMTSQDSVFLITKATEMFIEFLAKEANKQLGSGKRKTIMKRDVDVAIDNNSCLCFLDGALS
ncbi:unnamed protein product [Phaedon cochleariae]|uniref:Transcription factor CBF/NF-Y/archaeal histone domain-containing protein n=1 Tax=Phaedon cochleariae TaxID=80249 RepID=A0A9P0GMC9_PHACE|nr:unnamed protein product [Phaedon cochleariae]